MTFFKTGPYFKTGLAAAALAATSLAFSAPAQAHGRRGGGDDAAIAIGAGVLGLAVGAAIASDNNNQVFVDQGFYPGYPPYGAYAYPAYPVHPGWGGYPVYPGWRGPVYGGPVYGGPVFRGYDPRWDRRWGRRGWRGNPRWGHRGGGWRGW